MPQNPTGRVDDERYGDVTPANETQAS